MIVILHYNRIIMDLWYLRSCLIDEINIFGKVVDTVIKNIWRVSRF